MPRYNSIAEEYEKVRPGYPDGLMEALIKNTGIDINSCLLEVGAGTGKATLPLAEQGLQIDCIELELKMAKILSQKVATYPNVSVKVDNFETWEPVGGQKYDLIYSAQAFHWINEKIKYQKCHQLLTEAGHLAVFWYFSFIESQEMFEAINEVFTKYNTGFSSAGPNQVQGFFDREKGKLEQTEYFTNIRSFTYESEAMDQSAEVFVERFNTTSAYASMEPEKQAMVNDELIRVINERGGNVTSRLMYMLFVGEPVSHYSCEWALEKGN